MDHGNLTSNQVILYQEIQFPGMDVVFYVYPYTLPVYPHPASQRFPFLVSTICHGCPRTSPIVSNGSHMYCAVCDWKNERVTWQMKTNI